MTLFQELFPEEPRKEDSKIFVLKMIVCVIERDTSNTLYGEEIQIDFPDEKRLLGGKILNYYDNASVAYWVRRAVFDYLFDPNINNAPEELLRVRSLMRGKQTYVDATAYECINKTTEQPIKIY